MTQSRGQSRAWCHPADDPTVSLAGYVSQHDQDPRALGQGPCGDLHRNPLGPRTENCPAEVAWAGSQYGRWLDCCTCGMRLGYWPKEEYVGKYRIQENPHTVQLALDVLRDSGDWNNCSKAKMKAYIKKTEAEQHLRGAAAREERQPPPATPAPRTTPPRQPPGGTARRAQARRPATPPDSVAATSLPSTREASPAPSFGDTVAPTWIEEGTNATWPQLEEEDAVEVMSLAEMRSAMQDLMRENRWLRGLAAASSTPPPVEDGVIVQDSGERAQTDPAGESDSSP